MIILSACQRRDFIFLTKKGVTGTAFVKNGNERCGHTEYCDIKPGPVLGQAVSRPSMEHTIFVIIISDQQTVWTAVRSAHYPVILQFTALHHSTLDYVFPYETFYCNNGHTSNPGHFGNFKLRPTSDEPRILSSDGCKPLVTADSDSRTLHVPNLIRGERNIIRPA